MQVKNIYDIGLIYMYLDVQIMQKFTLLQYPFTHFGYLTHSSQVGPDQPSLQLQNPGLVQYA